MQSIGRCAIVALFSDHKAMPDQTNTLVQMRRRIDAAVRVARTADVVSVVGRVVCAAVAAIVLAALVDLQLRPSGVWAGGSMVAAISGLLLWRLVVSSSRCRTDRLRIAQAFEAAHPELGEIISRSIDFLDAQPATAPDVRPPMSHADTSQALRLLAVSQAAQALHTAGRLPRLGLRQGLLWGALGTVLVASLSISGACLPPVWWQAIRRQLVPITMSQWSQSVVLQGPTAAVPAVPPLNAPRILSPGAIGIAEAAEFETKLAGLLWDRFTNSPGLSSASLSARDRGDLDQLATLHADCLAGLAVDRAALQSQPIIDDSQQEDMRVAWQHLVALDELALPQAIDALIDNRLAIAADASAQAATILRQAATALGSATAVNKDRLRSRLIKRLERFAIEAASRVAANGGSALSAVSPVESQDSESTEQGHSASGVLANSGLQSPVAASGTPTQNPTGSAAGSVGTSPDSKTVDGLEADVDRVWNILPQSVRPWGSRSDDAVLSVNPAYRLAVEGYYRLLLETAESSGGQP